MAEFKFVVTRLGNDYLVGMRKDDIQVQMVMDKLQFRDYIKVCIDVLAMSEEYFSEETHETQLQEKVNE